jgi:hypothetical protein
MQTMRKIKDRENPRKQGRSNQHFSSDILIFQSTNENCHVRYQKVLKTMYLQYKASLETTVASQQRKSQLIERSL